VKECFILADIGKNLIASNMKDHLAELINKKKEIEGWTNAQVDQMINDKQTQKRMYRFNAWSWKLERLPLHTLGVYPKMNELPDRYCFGTVPKTSVQIKRLLDGSEGLGICEITDELKKRLQKLLQMWNMMRTASQEDVDQYLQVNPIIVVKGGQIRGPFKKKGYEIFDWDIDDGSSRAVIVAMIGRDRLLVYAGTPS